jgi:ABC-type amino acid transport substrate-binding protein
MRLMKWVDLGRWGILALLLLAARVAGAGDLADVKARGKLILVTYPVQGGFFTSVNLDRMRERNLKFGDLRRPEEFQGIDIDLTVGFAKSLGVALEIHPINEGWGGLIPALLDRKGDLVASELTITPERQKVADFSRPYVRSWIAVAVRKGSPIATVADLAGKKAALLSGSSHIEFLQQTVPGVEIQTTGFDLESFEAVESGSAEYALTDTTVSPGEPVDALHPDLKIALRLREVGDGVAVRKGSDLLPPLESYLQRLEESGELKRILDRHGFGKAKH